MTRNIIQHSNTFIMKILNFLSVALFVAFAFSSCDKDSVVSVVDNTPEFEVVEETTTGNQITLGLTTITCEEIALATFYATGETDVNNYSLTLQGTNIGGGDALFAGAWAPEEAETELQERTYTDIDGSVTAISEEGLEAYQAWIDAGSNPDTEPDLFEYMEFYDASGLSYTVSNITETTADVEMNGEIIDSEGNAISVEGSFSATLY